MLNIMRKSANTLVIKILLVFIALSFVVWGVGDYVKRSSQHPIAQGHGWAISPHEFSSAYENEYQRLRQRFGGTLDKKTAELLGLKLRTLNSLINRHLILAEGRTMHLTISPETLRKTIAETKAFSPNGVFDKQRYKLLLSNNRMTPQEYERQLMADLVAEQIQKAVGQIVTVPQALVADAYSLANEKREVATLKLSPKDLLAEFNPTDAELTEFLKKNQAQFMTPVKVKLRYVLLNADSVRDSVVVSDEEMKEFYDEHLAEFKKEETRQARHILAKIDKDAKEDSALEKIQQASKRIKDGESFESVAKAISEDSSAAQGGDLGTFGRGMMVKPFEDAAFSLNEGEMSKPVRTEFGFHLIRVDKILPGEVRSLAQAKDEIKAKVVEKKAQDAVYNRSLTLEDQLFASGDLKVIAGELNLRYRETDFFSRNDAGKLEGIEKENLFLDSAFSTPKGEKSNMLELPESRFFALEVVDKQEPKPKELQQARDEIVQAVKAEKSDQKASEQMKAVVKTLSEGKTWEQAAALHKSIQAKKSSAFTRSGGKDSPSTAIRNVAFKLSLKKPNHPDVIEENDEYIVVRLTKTEPADPKEMEKSQKKLEAQLGETLGQELMSGFLDGLRSRASIKIFQDMVERF